MKGKQIPLSERVRRIDRGLAADESAPVNAIQKFAALPLKDFFLDPAYYSEFMKAAEQMPRDFGFCEIHTYLDAVRLIAFCLRSDDEKLLETGISLLYDVSTNYIDMYVVLRGRNDEKYRESMHDVVREKCISAKPLAERLGSMPSGKITGFPALYLPVNQLYHGAAVLAGNDQPDRFYREMVLPFIGSTLMKQANLENTAAALGYFGGVTATSPDEDDDQEDFYAEAEGDLFDPEFDDDTAECTDPDGSSDAADSDDPDGSRDVAGNDGADESNDTDENDNAGEGGFAVPASINEKNGLIWYIAVMPYILGFGEKENAV
ncbi:MAG: hypothetical protein LIO99_14720 [Clostridiales bacterium]|nr:hypothetical protein [Clostridiales bacterium]